MKKSDFMKFFKDIKGTRAITPDVPRIRMKIKIVFKNGDLWNFDCSYYYFRDIRRNIRTNLKPEDFKEISSFSFD